MHYDRLVMERSHPSKRPMVAKSGPYLKHLQQRDGKSTINRTSRNAFQVQHEDQAVALDIEPEGETKLQ